MTRIGLGDIYSFNKAHAPTGSDSTIQHLGKNVIGGYTGFDYIKQHFGYREIETSVLNGCFMK